MPNQHAFNIESQGDIFYYLPRKITMPEGSEKYISAVWFEEYTLQLIAHRIYGNVDLHYLILAANDLASPFVLKPGDQFRFLKPDHLKDVVYG